MPDRLVALLTLWCHCLDGIFSLFRFSLQSIFQSSFLLVICQPWLKERQKGVSHELQMKKLCENKITKTIQRWKELLQDQDITVEFARNDSKHPLQFSTNEYDRIKQFVNWF
jgi:hypothetical protein